MNASHAPRPISSRCIAALLVLTPLPACTAAPHRSSLAFNDRELKDPDPLYWPGYFWLWNGPLNEQTIRKQLDDMHARGARSVCVLPMPHAFRPDSTNNQLDVEYLSPQFFNAVKMAVDHSARLNMNYWLYDEGGWPSGLALGQVVKSDPNLAARSLEYRDNAWNVTLHNHRSDLLNPATTDTFIRLTHEQYRAAVGNHFGKTIRYTFTDEPSLINTRPGHSLTWTFDFNATFAAEKGYPLASRLGAFTKDPASNLTIEERRTRVDFFDHLAARYCRGYFQPLQNWAHRNALGSGGHLDNDHFTAAAISQAFSNPLRQLRAMDIPGIDVIWRQLWPANQNHHFPKFASSAAHHTGHPHAFTESFCVYGNGLTLAQTKWLTDYQYVRGINVLVGGCYPYSTQDHLMCGERPHFGPVNPLWDHLPAYHAYVARLGYCLSRGTPLIDIALYFPARDMWADGRPDDPVVTTHDEIARRLLASQRDFDLIDDDILSAEAARIDNGRLAVADMRYKTVLLPPVHWLTPLAAKKLADFAAAGGNVIALTHAPGIDGDDGAAFARLTAPRIAETIPDLIAPAAAIIQADPPAPDLRVCARSAGAGRLYFLTNEAFQPVTTTLTFPEKTAPNLIDPVTAEIRSLSNAALKDSASSVPVSLAPWESRLFLFDGKTYPPAPTWADRSITLDNWQSHVTRTFAVGPHDYEIKQTPDAPFAPAALGPWTAALTDDFSGTVTYRTTLTLPEPFRNRPLQLQLGNVEYAAAVRLDGRFVAQILWPPFTCVLPPHDDAPLTLELDVTNTLANLLTSDKVRKDIDARKGPGWPGPYHKRALEFEAESRHGGLYPPVTLRPAA